ncbi:MAG: alkyl hydroperoxide reductase subunit F [Bacteroidales bacterium]
MLDKSLLEQVRTLFLSLKHNFLFKIIYHPTYSESQELIQFLEEVASCSERVSCESIVSDEPKLEFSLLKEGEELGIKFKAIPSGHEFSSLLLAILNSDGIGKNLPDEAIARRISSLNVSIHIDSYISLSCTNCPDIVQALNVMALYNRNITHDIVDGSLYKQEVEKLNIQAVPTVYANGKLLHVGRGSLGELLEKLENSFGVTHQEQLSPIERSFDLIVMGGGPAGASAAIYSARKGLKVAIVSENVGGQVKETVAIENLISTPYTTGVELANSLRTHIQEYDISIFEQRRVESVTIEGKEKLLNLAGGEVFRAPALIVATGASWRKLNIDGEQEYIGRGVAFCPHCDGPFYAGKEVAVIGGGNSGVEAAIDLAGICSKVTLLEYADTLRADQVLQEKARSMPNITIHTSSETSRVIGNGEKVRAILVKDRTTQQEKEIPLDGIFVQIGLAANSSPFKDMLEMSPIGEIKIDSSCRTSIPGIYAAGDVSDIPFKQIIIAMGEGAKAALSAFDDRIRGII